MRLPSPQVDPEAATGRRSAQGLPIATREGVEDQPVGVVQPHLGLRLIRGASTDSVTGHIPCGIYYVRNGMCFNSLLVVAQAYVDHHLRGGHNPDPPARVLNLRGPSAVGLLKFQRELTISGPPRSLAHK
jgi:hypothetical protein